MDFYRHALALVTEATSLEEREHHEEAFALYISALEFFERALREERDAGNRDTIKRGMVLPLERAERLKYAKERGKSSEASVELDEPSMLDRLGRMLRSALEPTTKTVAATATPPAIPSRPSSAPAGGLPRLTTPSSSSFAPPGPSTKVAKKQKATAVGAVTAAPTAANAYPELQGIDKTMQKKILDLAVEGGQGVSWDDIAGLNAAKRALYEMVILPSLRPDFFTGLRKPPTGLMLFGPPGCGKTMLAKAVATEAKAAFFSISASALMSKYLGESEGLVKALFAVARAVAPSVVFIDEIDSLLSERSDQEHEASRRVKTEFLIQWDGIQAHSGGEKRILVMGATNRPQDLDEAATRRMPKRVYIPLPDVEARKGAVKRLLADTPNSISERQLTRIAELTEYYSQSDLKSLCSQAAMFPVREMPDIRTAPLSALRPIAVMDFEEALKLVRPSVDPASIARYEQYNDQFGSTGV